MCMQTKIDSFIKHIGGQFYTFLFLSKKTRTSFIQCVCVCMYVCNVHFLGDIRIGLVYMRMLYVDIYTYMFIYICVICSL